MSNRIRLSLVAAASFMALVLIAFFATQAWPTAASADGAPKIAVIDTEKILLSSTTGKAALATLKKAQEKAEKDLGARAQELKDLQNKIQDGQQSLPASQLAELKKQLDEKEAALRRLQDDTKRDLDKKRDNILADIDQKVMPQINQIGKELGYTLIFRKFESGLIYADDAIDITAMVIQRFDTGGFVAPPTTGPGAPASTVGASASGNVGVGTTNPKYNLHIFKSGGRDNVLLGLGNGSREWTLGINGGSDFFRITDQTAGVARLSILNNGRVGIGTNDPDQVFSVNGDASKTGGGSWQVFSDARLKHIRGPFNSGLSAVVQLQPLRYEYRRDNVLGLKAEGEHVGFAAQDLQKIIPEAVSRSEKGYLMVNNDPILWAMLNAIKEQQKEIAELKGQVRKSPATLGRR